MRRRDVPKALLAATAGAAFTASTAQGQSCAPCQLAFPGDVTLFGADKTGKDVCDTAINAALAAHAVVYFPAGVYRVDGPIQVLGSRTILGPRGGSHANQAALIWHTPQHANGNLFELIGDYGGGACIANLHITGGNGGFVIVSNRQQSVFENLYMEGVTTSQPPYPFSANGIQLTACSCAGDPPANYNYGSWDTVIRNCKWVAPPGLGYRGYVISSSGGRLTVDNCVAEGGAIGFDIDRVEALVLDRVLAHNQNRDNASAPAISGQCGIRLIGPAPKQAISINGSYIEGCETGIWAENVESLDIANTYFDDLGYGGNAIYLRNASVVGTTIRNCSILHRSTQRAAVENHGTKTLMTHTAINGFSSGVIALKNTAQMHTLGNTLLPNNVLDTGGHIYDLDCQDVELTLSVAGSGSAGSYPIAGQQCSYTRVGRRVWVDIDITFASASVGGGSGYLCIQGLPHPKRNATLPVGAAQLHAVAFSGNVTLGFATSATDPTLCLYQTTANGGIEALPAAAISAGDRIMGSISYRI